MLMIPAILEGYRTLKDRTFHIGFGTNELSPEKIGELHQSLQQFGYLAFKVNSYNSEDLKILNRLDADIEDSQKTPGSRLRSVLFLIWKKEPEGYTDYNLYYRFKMEKIISHYKEKLD